MGRLDPRVCLFAITALAMTSSGGLRAQDAVPHAIRQTTDLVRVLESVIFEAGAALSFELRADRVEFRVDPPGLTSREQPILFGVTRFDDRGLVEYAVQGHVDREERLRRALRAVRRAEAPPVELLRESLQRVGARLGPTVEVSAVAARVPIAELGRLLPGLELPSARFDADPNPAGGWAWAGWRVQANATGTTYRIDIEPIDGRVIRIERAR